MNVERLWAPWRSGYLLHRGRRRCIFCLARRSTADRQHHVVRRGRHVFALLNRYPYTNGHLMIAPYRHIGRLTSLNSREWHGMLQLAQQMTQRLRGFLHPHGFNIGLNVGRVAGAGFPGHLHLHLVPRWHGDTNFMPVLAETRIIAQSLEELYDRLASGAR